MKMINNISYILIGLSLNVNKDTRVLHRLSLRLVLPDLLICLKCSCSIRVKYSLFLFQKSELISHFINPNYKIIWKSSCKYLVDVDQVFL